MVSYDQTGTHRETDPLILFALIPHHTPNITCNGLHEIYRIFCRPLSVILRFCVSIAKQKKCNVCFSIIHTMKY